MSRLVPGTDWMPLLERAASELGLAARAPGTALRRISAYLDHLTRWNEKMDLTAARSPDELVDLSLADALILAHHTAPGTASWVDVGSGAGAPGLVLALLRPDLELTLVEPREKRVAFLRSVAGSLDATNVRVVRARADALTGAAWDVAVARATLPPEVWLREGARLARGAVWLLLARDPAPAHTGRVTDVDQGYDWPLTRVARRALRFVPAQDAIDGGGASCEK